MWTLLALLGIYAGTSVLGTGIRLQWWDTSRFRWVHHALFGGIWLALAVAIAWAFNTGAAWRWLVVWIVPCMALLPRFRAGSVSHCLTAVVGLATLIGAILWAWIS